MMGVTGQIVISLILTKFLQHFEHFLTLLTKFSFHFLNGFQETSPEISKDTNKGKYSFLKFN